MSADEYRVQFLTPETIREIRRDERARQASYIDGLVLMSPAFGWGDMSTDDALTWIASEMRKFGGPDSDYYDAMTPAERHRHAAARREGPSS